jgi:hypothetical protein
MKKSLKILLSAFAVILLAGLGTIFVLYRGSSVRIAREHGVFVPLSAAPMRCGGDGWKHWFSDCAAIATFEIPAADLPAFIAALAIRQEFAGFGGQSIPSNYSDFILPSWASAKPNSSYGCASPTGTYLNVCSWSLSDSRVGILLYTDWN